MRSFVLIICLVVGIHYLSDSENPIMKYFENSPYIELDAFTKDLILDFNYKDSLLLSIDIMRYMYPDSITSISNFDDNPCYAYGMYKITDSYFSVIVLREHGEWLKTLDLLSYNHNNELQSIVYLAGVGYDGGYSFKGWGEFINDSTYRGIHVSKYYEIDLLEEVVTFESYDSTVLITKFDHLRKVINITNPR